MKLKSIDIPHSITLLPLIVGNYQTGFSLEYLVCVVVFFSSAALTKSQEYRLILTIFNFIFEFEAKVF